MKVSKILKTRKGKRKCKSKTTTSHICEYCNKEFPKAAYLVRHERVHTGEKPFVCNLCGHSASQKGQLQIHMRAHLKEKPFNCPEEGCSYAAVSKGAVTTHHNAVHVQEKRFQCPVASCGFKTGWKSGLTQHMKTHEENPFRPFQCHLCPYKAKLKSMIKSHVNQVHSTERKFPCPHSTEGCNYKAKTRSNLSNHIKSHGEKTLSCPFSNSGSGSGCEYKTKRKDHLKKHMLIHTPNSQSEKNFKCRICDFSARRSQSLVIHIRTHTKETPFKCGVERCSFQAKQPSSLTLHVRAVHEKLRPFKCPLCSYAAAKKQTLKAHLKRKHPEATESNSS